MNRNYRQLTDSINFRNNPENIARPKMFSEEISTIAYSDVLVFVRTAMKGVEPEYTEKSILAGERVKGHLKDLSNVSFKYQGSVMTNTHIKGYSDIDLLSICEKFYSYDAQRVKAILESSSERTRFYSSLPKLENEINTSSYAGNSTDDLRKIRRDCEEKLSQVYPICDITKAKSIKIENSSLKRHVDIVVASWYDDVTSIINDKGDFRGIQIFNKEKNSTENADYPFLSIKRINERGKDTNGRLKKMIRFLKNIRSISDHEIDLSSFDINAICYNIEVTKYQNASFIDLVPILYFHIKSICENKEHSDNVTSVDGREYIFRYNATKLSNLKSVFIELQSIFLDLHQNQLLK